MLHYRGAKYEINLRGFVGDNFDGELHSGITVFILIRWDWFQPQFVAKTNGFEMVLKPGHGDKSEQLYDDLLWNYSNMSENPRN